MTIYIAEYVYVKYNLSFEPTLYLDQTVPLKRYVYVAASVGIGGSFVTFYVQLNMHKIVCIYHHVVVRPNESV